MLFSFLFSHSTAALGLFLLPTVLLLPSSRDPAIRKRVGNGGVHGVYNISPIPVDILGTKTLICNGRCISCGMLMYAVTRRVRVVFYPPPKPLFSSCYVFHGCDRIFTLPTTGTVSLVVLSCWRLLILPPRSVIQPTTLSPTTS